MTRRIPLVELTTSTLRWCVAAAVLSAAAVIATDLTPFREPLILHVLPIAFAAYLGGLVPGLVATLTMMFGAALLLSAPRLSLAIDDPMQLLEVISLGVTGVIVSLLCEVLRRSRRSVEFSLQVAVTSERRFSDSFHESPVAQALTRLDTREIAEVNAAYVNLLGWSRAELIGRTGSDLELYPVETRERLLRRLQRSGPIRNHREALRRRDDVMLDVVLAMNLVEIDGVAHSLTTIVDETERKRAEAAQRASDEQLRELAGKIDEVFWVTNAMRDQLLYISPGYEKVWGRSCASLYANPMDWFEAVHPDDRAHLAEKAAIVELPDGHEDEFRIVRPDGAIRWIHARLFATRDEHGRTVRSIGVATDITDGRMLEEQLRQTQKMESLGMLAGGVAHDFNNVLAVISSCNGLLAESIPQAAPDRELVDEIESAVTRAVQLTGQLLAFSRKQVAAPAIVDVNVAVRDARKMLRRLLGEDVAIVHSLDPEVASVRIDPGHLSQVVMNLAVNARDAMPRGGRLELATRSIDIAPLGRAVCLSVTDTGAGMSDEVRARAFEPFFTTKEPGKGTGLGLAVVHGIVEQAGGKLELESRLGVGTTFRIYLPAIPATAKSELVQGEHTGEGPETILLVDDDEHVRKVAARMLRAKGYHVLEADSGSAALGLLSDHPIDLLLTDVVMPHLDGRRLAELAHGAHPELKVLFMSGYTDDAVVRYGVQRGEIDYVEKPFQGRSLAARVRQVLDRERFHQRSACP
ncbi:MAG TPA: ATP-binding protein [Kofleriaceae bacterium]|jgi:PAS domain S-box-containing protein